MMPLVCHRRLVIRLFALGLEALVPGFISVSTLIPIAVPNNNLFLEFMRTFIKKAQVLAATIARALDVKTIDNTNKHLKSRNLDLYYSNLLMDYYYFY